MEKMGWLRMGMEPAGLAEEKGCRAQIEATSAVDLQSKERSTAVRNSRWPRL